MYNLYKYYIDRFNYLCLINLNEFSFLIECLKLFYKIIELCFIHRYLIDI